MSAPLRDALEAATTPQATEAHGGTVRDTHQIPTQPLPEDNDLEADDALDSDSALGSDNQSDTTSVTSAMLRGYVEHGRRYSRAGEWQPTDDQQFEAMEHGHILYMIMECQQENPLFRSPISEDPQYILDLGTGHAEWAVDTADRYPNATVHGVDLYPPPQPIVPPNCILEVDDISRPWTWSNKWDLIHLRHLIGSFSPDGWKQLYKQAYDNLAPGGWIEQLESDGGVYCDDGTLPSDSILNHATFRDVFSRAGEKAGRPCNTSDTMKDAIEAAGFINVQYRDYKVPIGDWPKHPVYKDAGRVNMLVWKSGTLEGWLIWLLTNFADPEPMSWEAAQLYLAEVRKEIGKRYHVYQPARRVWAQKPFAKKEKETAAANAASPA